jgi:hypothetical protein
VTNGPWLFYGKVGGGWVGTDDFTITNLTTGASITGSNNGNSGWLVGAGIEWAFAPNWSAKVEYSFLGLDDRTFVAPVGFISPAGFLFTGNSFFEREPRHPDGEGGRQLPFQLEGLWFWLWLSLATHRRNLTGGVSDVLLAGRVVALPVRKAARS